jgi:hypothetical protein
MVLRKHKSTHLGPEYGKSMYFQNTGNCPHLYGANPEELN